VETNIAGALRLYWLPGSEVRAESCLAAISTPSVILMTPMSSTILRVPSLLLSDEKGGLVETKSCIWSASYSANFSAPTHNRPPAGAEDNYSHVSERLPRLAFSDLAATVLVFMKLHFSMET
jgi:hypothetical protein